MSVRSRAKQAAGKLPWEKEVNVIGRWIFAHPHWKKAFPDHKPADVIQTLLFHLNNRGCKVAFGAEGEIVGVILFRDEPDYVNCLHFLGQGEMIMYAALEAWKESYPGRDVKVFRHGKERIYEFKQFFKEE